MICSHWGMFPGWWQQPRYADGSYRIADAATEWLPVDWADWLAVIEMLDARLRDQAAYEAAIMRRCGVKFH